MPLGLGFSVTQSPPKPHRVPPPATDSLINTASIIPILLGLGSQFVGGLSF